MTNRNTTSQEKWSASHWWMLALMTLTGTLVAAIQQSCLPPLFKEISDELGLDLVQIGSVWGFSNMAGIFVSIIGGILTARFGVKRIVVIFCILVGITGALRGIADNYIMLLVMVFINGTVRMVIPVAVTTSIGLWFKGPRLGMAMGIGAMGIGLGLTLGPLLSATVLSPWLGGWRNVLYFLGGIAIIIGVVWYFAKEPVQTGKASSAAAISTKSAINELVRVKNVWLLGLLLLFRSGGMMGINGYVPLYLRGLGWSPASADGTLSAFFALSTACVIPLAYLSDRLDSRKAILIPAAITATLGIGFLPILDGAGVWAAMIITGMFMDSFMSLSMTLIAEDKGVKPEYTGIALGMMMSLGSLGGVIAPPLGNALATVAQPGNPFYLWSALSAASLVLLLIYREKRTLYTPK